MESAIAIPIFDGDNYQVWAVRMKVYIEALDLWEAVEEDYLVPQLPNNPMMTQMKAHTEKKTKKSKAKACLFSGVSSAIFTRIMNLETTNQIWDYIKKEYQDNERTKNMQTLNLIREFEMMKMKESETIKDYSDKLLSIVDKVRLLGKIFDDDRIVQKILVILPEKYESKISSLEESKDLSSISLAELVSALQAVEQRRLMRNEDTVDGAFKVTGDKNKSNNNNVESSPCPHCKMLNHMPNRCWWRPDIKCRRCGNMGHVEKVCKEQQTVEIAKVSTEQQEQDLDALF